MNSREILLMVGPFVDVLEKEVRCRTYNELYAYYQDLIPPGGEISRSELLARLSMLEEEQR